MSENVLKILTDDQIKDLAKLIDEALPFNEWIKNPIVGGIAEAGDYYAAKVILNGLNNQASPLVPDVIKDEIQLAVSDCLDGDGDFSVAIDQIDEVGSQLMELTEMSAKVKSTIKSLLGLIELALNYLNDKKKSA